MLGQVNDSQFGRVVLVTGPESLLADRAVADAVTAARAERPESSVNTVEAAVLDAGTLAEVTGGSLFASSTVVVLTNLAEVPPTLVDQVASLAEHPMPDLALVLVHAGGVKGKALLDRVRKARATVIECPTVKPWELPQFASAEARRLGGRMDAMTAGLLVEAVGTDLRTIAAAVRQLLADAEEAIITESAVRRYFGGRADVTSFAVADDTMAGRPDQALGKLRWALSTGVPAVLVTSALSTSLRNLGRYLDARDARVRDADLARSIGVPPWKLKDLARQARDWQPGGVARAIQAVAIADAQVKGAASDPGFALERMVLTVVGCRRRPLERC